jgi:hypothetical protein
MRANLRGLLVRYHVDRAQAFDARRTDLYARQPLTQAFPSPKHEAAVRWNADCQ